DGPPSTVRIHAREHDDPGDADEEAHQPSTRVTLLRRERHHEQEVEERHGRVRDRCDSGVDARLAPADEENGIAMPTDPSTRPRPPIARISPAAARRPIRQTRNPTTIGAAKSSRSSTSAAGSKSRTPTLMRR